MDSNLVTIAGVMLGIGIAIMLFRLSRELAMRERRERNWLAYSELLVVGACILSAIVLLLPVFGAQSRQVTVLLPRSAILAGVVMLIGYIPGILAHYRFIGGKRRPPLRENPEPIERSIVLGATVIAVLAFLGTYFL
jgi:hypothetical protein